MDATAAMRMTGVLSRPVAMAASPMMSAATRLTDDKGFSDLLKELSFFKNDLEALLSQYPKGDALKSE